MKINQAMELHEALTSSLTGILLENLIEIM